MSSHYYITRRHAMRVMGIEQDSLNQYFLKSINILAYLAEIVYFCKF